MDNMLTFMYLHVEYKFILFIVTNSTLNSHCDATYSLMHTDLNF